MVKALLLGLVLVMCGLAAVCAPMTPGPPAQEEDPAARNERSTNLSFVAGTARKIQMFIKNRHLQLLPDGTVNGTTDDTSPYTILQRTTVGVGQMKIQGVATCQYLCMDICGLLYGSKEFGDECIFNETIEQHYYNTYSSSKYSNDKRTLYLALNRRGQPRKVMLRAKQQLGRLSSYTRVLTRTVPPERVEEMHHTRHHAHMCATPSQERNPHPLADPPTDVPRCRKRKKRKKKRKCDDENEQCLKKSNSNKKQTKVKKCEEEECQRDVNKKKKNSEKSAKKKRPLRKGKAHVTTTTPAPVVLEETTTDVEDYGADSTTHISDFDDYNVTDSLLLEPSNSQLF